MMATYVTISYYHDTFRPFECEGELPRNMTTIKVTVGEFVAREWVWRAGDRKSLGDVRMDAEKYANGLAENIEDGRGPDICEYSKQTKTIEEWVKI